MQKWNLKETQHTNRYSTNIQNNNNTCKRYQNNNTKMDNFSLALLSSAHQVINKTKFLITTPASSIFLILVLAKKERKKKWRKFFSVNAFKTYDFYDVKYFIKRRQRERERKRSKRREKTKFTLRKTVFVGVMPEWKMKKHNFFLFFISWLTIFPFNFESFFFLFLLIFLCSLFVKIWIE